MATKQLPTERVRRSITPVGQVSIGTVQRDGETAYTVKLQTPAGVTDTEQRPASTGKISIPVRMRRDEDEYVVERTPAGIILTPVADDYEERTIVLEPTNQQ